MLEVENLFKSFGKKQVLNDISFVANEGKIFGILGRNGAGKTTLFRCILNIITQDTGKILFDKKKLDDKLKDKIGYLPEEGALNLNNTVYEQCIFYASLKGIEETQAKARLENLLERLNILEYMNTKLKELSKGNRQKISLIIAMLHNPKLVILDEPFSGLDPISVEEFKKVIIDLKNQGIVIIFSSHRMDHVEMICDDILIIDKGKEILKGNLDEIKKSFESKLLVITGNIDEEVISKIDGVIEISKNLSDNVSGNKEKNKNTYILKLANSQVKSELVRHLDFSEIDSMSNKSVSLNDIFIERVGKSYED